MKIFSDSQIVNMRAEQSAVKAALAASLRSVARGWRAASLFLLAACSLLIALAALQVLFIGGMDTLGFAPQVSFLCLSFALIALFSALALPSIRLNLWSARWRTLKPSEATKGSRVFSINASAQARPVCKVLVIRRLAQDAQADIRDAWRTFDGRSKGREVTFNA